MTGVEHGTDLQGVRIGISSQVTSRGRAGKTYRSSWPGTTGRRPRVCAASRGPKRHSRRCSRARNPARRARGVLAATTDHDGKLAFEVDLLAGEVLRDFDRVAGILEELLALMNSTGLSGAPAASSGAFCSESMASRFAGTIGARIFPGSTTRSVARNSPRMSRRFRGRASVGARRRRAGGGEVADKAHGGILDRG